ncbi:unnamed protein product, partial [marine sediment metagenome]
MLISEYHKDGRVHWHMLIDAPVGRRWLKDSAAACGLGWITDCQPVHDSYRTIMYVAKYLGKTIDNVQWPRNLRRIGTSQKWPVLPDLYEDHVDTG